MSRHVGRDSRQVILPVALRVNANLFQTDLCRHPGHMEVMGLYHTWYLGSGIPCRNDGFGG
jgi:hypothetical protein